MKYFGLVSCKCPYCGYVTNLSYQSFENQRVEAISCGCDNDGGCGKLYAVRPVLHVDVEVYKMTEVKA